MSLAISNIQLYNLNPLLPLFSLRFGQALSSLLFIRLSN